MPNATTNNSLSKLKMTNPSTPPLSKMWEIALPTPLGIDAPARTAAHVLLHRYQPW